MQVRSRKDAIAAGMTRYCTGKPCRHGHVAERDVINCTCVECTLDWKRGNQERVRAYSREYYAAHRDSERAHAKAYAQTESGSAAAKRSREKNRDKRNAGSRRWRMENPEKQAAADQCWRARNPSKDREYQKAAYERDPEKFRLKGREWRTTNKERAKEIQQKTYNKYLDKNRERSRVYFQAHKAEANEYWKSRRAGDVNVRLAASLRSGIHRVFTGRIKGGSAVADLGCSVDELRRHIEALFSAEMTWDNRGSVWQLDHIVPLAAFDLSDREQFLCACHYTNLRPLLVEDHKRKSAGEKRIRSRAGQASKALRGLASGSTQVEDSQNGKHLRVDWCAPAA